MVVSDENLLEGTRLTQRKRETQVETVNQQQQGEVGQAHTGSVLDHLETTLQVNGWIGCHLSHNHSVLPQRTMTIVCCYIGTRCQCRGEDSVCNTIVLLSYSFGALMQREERHPRKDQRHKMESSQ